MVGLGVSVGFTVGVGVRVENKNIGIDKPWQEVNKIERIALKTNVMKVCLLIRF